MSHTIVIFGASGDFTSRKLIPALYSLAHKKRLPEDTKIVGFSRSPFAHDEWRKKLTVAKSAKPAETKKAPISLTANAIAKVKETMAQQNPVPTGLRVGVVGGGCSGFSYSMQFENGAGAMDKTFEFGDLKVYIDATSLMYLQGAIVDYVESLEGAGFKFENPNVKSTCGCGSSFSV
jgi:iron-sulfur cluster assembly accessory protein